MRLTKESLTQHMLKSEARDTVLNTVFRSHTEIHQKLGAVFNDAARETVSSKQNTWRGAALPSGQSKTDPSPSALPERTPRAHCSPAAPGTLPFESEICLILVS